MRTHLQSVKLSSDDIDKIKYYYSSHLGTKIEIDKAYQVKLKMKFGNKSDYKYINVLKFHGEGWKISEEFINDLMI